MSENIIDMLARVVCETLDADGEPKPTRGDFLEEAVTALWDHTDDLPTEDEVADAAQKLWKAEHD